MGCSSFRCGKMKVKGAVLLGKEGMEARGRVSISLGSGNSSMCK